jgi:hypothetical protein
MLPSSSIFVLVLCCILFGLSTYQFTFFQGNFYDTICKDRGFNQSVSDIGIGTCSCPQIGDHDSSDDLILKQVYEVRQRVDTAAEECTKLKDRADKQDHLLTRISQIEEKIEHFKGLVERDVTAKETLITSLRDTQGRAVQCALCCILNTVCILIIPAYTRSPNTDTGGYCLSAQYKRVIVSILPHYFGGACIIHQQYSNQKRGSH